MNTQDEAVREALRILEAAGVDPKNGQPGNAEEAARKAAYWLKEAAESTEDERRIRAEREAEDAKVRAFWRTAKPGSYCYDGPVMDEDRAGYYAARAFIQQEGDANTAQALHDLDICHHDDTPTGDLTTEELADALGHTLPTPGFLADARAEFAAHAHQELAQPATIDDAEDIGPSHRRRQWVDQDGLIWSYDYKAGNWGYRTRHGKSRTVDIPDSFPWTEVTKDAGPHVIQHGDPEPDRNKAWADRDGDTWRYAPGKGWRFNEGTYSWDVLLGGWGHIFPWTEVAR